MLVVVSRTWSVIILSKVGSLLSTFSDNCWWRRESCRWVVSIVSSWPHVVTFGFILNPSSYRNSRSLAKSGMLVIVSWAWSVVILSKVCPLLSTFFYDCWWRSEFSKWVVGIISSWTNVVPLGLVLNSSSYCHSRSLANSSMLIVMSWARAVVTLSKVSSSLAAFSDNSWRRSKSSWWVVRFISSWANIVTFGFILKSTSDSDWRSLTNGGMLIVMSWTWLIITLSKVRSGLATFLYDSRWRRESCKWVISIISSRANVITFRSIVNPSSYCHSRSLAKSGMLVVVSWTWSVVTLSKVSSSLASFSDNSWRRSKSSWRVISLVGSWTWYAWSLWTMWSSSYCELQK